MASTSFSAPTTASFDPNDKFVICDEELQGVQIEVIPVSCTGPSDGVRHLHDPGNVWAAFQGKQMILPFSGCFAFSITVKRIRQTSVQAVAMKLICENGLGKESNFALLKVDEKYFMSCNPGKDKREFVAYAPEEIGVQQGPDQNLCSFVMQAVILDEPVYESKGLTRSGVGVTRGGGGVTRGGMQGRNAVVGGGNETKNEFTTVKCKKKFEEVESKFRIKFQTATTYKRKKIDDDLEFEEDDKIDYSIHVDKKLNTGMYVNAKIQIKSSDRERGAQTLLPMPEVTNDGTKFIFHLEEDYYQLSFRFKQEQPDTWQKLKCVFVDENNQSRKKDEYDCILDSDAGYWFFPMALFNLKRDSGQGWLLKTKSNETILKMEFICQ